MTAAQDPRFRILVVDDEADNRTVLLGRLQALSLPNLAL